MIWSDEPTKRKRHVGAEAGQLRFRGRVTVDHELIGVVPAAVVDGVLAIPGVEQIGVGAVLAGECVIAEPPCEQVVGREPLDRVVTTGLVRTDQCGSDIVDRPDRTVVEHDLLYLFKIVAVECIDDSDLVGGAVEGQNNRAEGRAAEGHFPRFVAVDYQLVRCAPAIVLDDILAVASGKTHRCRRRPRLTAYRCRHRPRSCRPSGTRRVYHRRRCSRLPGWH